MDIFLVVTQTPARPLYQASLSREFAESNASAMRQNVLNALTGKVSALTERSYRDLLLPPNMRNKPLSEIAATAVADRAVSVVTVRMDAPRIVVAIDGGMLSGITADCEIAATVIDYDFADSFDHDDDLYAIPQGGGDTSNAGRREEAVEIDSAWIDAVVALDPLPIPDEEETLTEGIPDA